jgi:hypothetical protein
MDSFIPTENDKYECTKCHCIISKNSRYSHLLSQKHENNTKNNNIISMTNARDCDICYEEKNDFYKCVCCKNLTCSVCVSSIQPNYKCEINCPFCRNTIRILMKTKRRRTRIMNFNLLSPESSASLITEELMASLSEQVRRRFEFVPFTPY